MIKLNRYIIILLFGLVVTWSQPTMAQGGATTISQLSGEQIIQGVQSGSLTLSSVAQDVAAQTGATISETQAILQGLTSTTNNPVTTGQFLDQFRLGGVSTTLATEISRVQNLGSITGVSALESALTSAPVVQELQNVLAISGSTAMNQVIGSVANVLGGTTAVQQVLSPALNQSLSTTFNTLSTQLGGAFSNIANVVNVASAALQGLPELSMTQLLDGVVNSVIPVAQLDQALSQLANIPQTLASNITSNLLSNISGIDLAQAGQLLNLVQTGELPGNIAATLSAIPNLGNITSLTGLTNVLTSSTLTNAFNQALSSGGIAAFNQAISSVTNVLGGAAALQQLASGATSITSALSSVNSALSGAFGGLSNLQSQLTNLGTNFISQLSSSQIVQSIQSGVLSVTNAAQALATQLGQPLAQIQQTLQNLSIGGVNIAQAGQLLNQVISGQIPAALGQVLSSIPNLGNIANIANISSLISSGAITAQLQSILASGGVAAVNQAIAGITNALGGVAGVINGATAAGAAQIANALNTAAPALVGALGGVTALATGITGSLTSVLNLGVGGIVGSCTSPCDRGGNLAPPLPGGSCSATCATCAPCRPIISSNHSSIRSHVTNEFNTHRQWFVNTFINDNVLPAFARMSLQLSAVAMGQIEMIGRFFDAKHQLETQRLFQRLAARAHKDYTPSEGLCEFGTMMRSIAASDRRSDLATLTIADRSMHRLMRTGDVLSSPTADADKISRRAKFINTYCNEDDNGNGLTYLCGSPSNSLSQLQTQITNTQAALAAETNPILRTPIQNSLNALQAQLPAAQAAQRERINKDIDYVRTLDVPLTLELDFTTTTGATVEPDEEDVFALSANLYAHDVLPVIGARVLADGNGYPKTGAYKYMNFRSLAAKKSVAHNSYATIAGYKAAGDQESAPFLRRIIRDLGVPAAEIDVILGENPSYYAQMEVLTSALYKRNSFYTALVDKPVNVRRKSAALKTIDLMQERDIYNSLLRSEAILAVTLETMLQREDERTKRQLNSIPSQQTEVSR